MTQLRDAGAKSATRGESIRWAVDDRFSSGADDIALAQLLSARICHDLVGPVGALNNGVEFINGGVDQDGRDQAMRIIGDSARQAAAKLEYYRAAFGSGGGLGDEARQDAVHSLIAEYLFGSKVTLDWSPDGPDLARDAARLLLNLALLGIETLPRGGVLRVVASAGEGGAGVQLAVIADGPSIKLSPARRSLLSEGALEPGVRLEPSDAPALLTVRIAESLGGQIGLTVEADRAVVSAVL